VTVRILQGDCRVRMAELDAGSVHTVVTSPPYFGLRDYGHAEQIGLEATPDEFIAKLVEVFREVRRVLRDDGTCWVNMGDSYAGSWGAQSREHAGKHAPNVSALSANQVKAAQKRTQTGTVRTDGVKPKDLYGIPWMLAFALRADGWWLRQDIVWEKPNPMPESVRDRCTKAHEYVFLLSKSDRYYFDQGAISEVVAPSTVERLAQCVDEQEGSDRVPGKTNGRMKAVPPRFGGHKYGDSDDPKHQTKSGNEYTGSRRNSFARTTKDSAGEHGQTPQFREDREPVAYEGRRNKRSVWTVATTPFSEAHFATFPTKLIEPCILAGTSEKGCCPHCRAPWVRQTGRPCEKCEAFIPTQGKSCGSCGHVRDWKAERGISEGLNATEWDKPGRSVPRKLGESGKQGAVPPQQSLALDWAQSCSCPAHEPVPCTVLDPFGGSGTTGLVADRLQRNAILCELNAEYASMAERRVTSDAPLFAEVSP
jgi:DNA modification methylase